MDTIQLQKVDAFTDTPYTGNSAGVVLEAGGLSEAGMQSIAREVNASETAFVRGGESPGPFRVRFFTPAAEVPLCGHATIATFHALVWAGSIHLEGEETVVQMEANAGVLPLRLLADGSVLTGVMMGQQPPVDDRFEGSLDALSTVLGVPLEVLERGREGVAPPLIVSTGCRCLHVALPDLESVRAARPDFKAVAVLSGDLDIITVQIMTLDVPRDDVYAHVRTFAPAVGVDEDPVTGTAAGSLAGYLAVSGVLPGEGDRRIFTLEQGVEVGRPGRVEVEVELSDGKATAVWVGGSAVSVFSGECKIPGL